MDNVLISKKKLNQLYRIALSFQLRNQGGLAGQAFTEYVCLRCDSSAMHENTNTPIFCKDCKKQIREEYDKETP